jgi:hypothetical protein
MHTFIISIIYSPLCQWPCLYVHQHLRLVSPNRWCTPAAVQTFYPTSTAASQASAYWPAPWQLPAWVLYVSTTTWQTHQT